MADRKPYHHPAAHHQRQPHGEAVIRNIAAAAATDAVEENGGAADWLYLIDHAAGTDSDEAIAHELYMEELRLMEDWTQTMHRVEEPRLADDVSAAGAQHLGAVPDVFGGGGAAQANDANHCHPIGAGENDEAIAQELYMEELRQMEDTEMMHRFEEPLFAVGVSAPGAQGPAAAHAQQFGAVPRVFGCAPAPSPAQADAANHHHHPIGDGEETVTIPLEPRKAVVISIRQAIGASSSPGALAGMEDEEDADDNGWYDSIVHDAQRMEQMMIPDSDGPPTFEQQQPPRRSESPPMKEPCHDSPTTTTLATGEEDTAREFSLRNSGKRRGLHPSSELDPDEAAAGPSTKRQMTRVLPLADDDVPTFRCGICIEILPVLDVFHGTRCDHRFCVRCMTTYIEGRIDSGEVPIPCPDPACNKDGLHPEACKKSVDFAAFDDWGGRLAERAVPADRRAYCPNRACGVMLETTGDKTPAMAFCPACRQAMCAACGLDWSPDGSGEHDCAEGPDAALVKKLADERRWKQCPKCNMMVERTEGCRFIRCRCLCKFCYDCGRPWAQRQDGGEERCRCNAAFPIRHPYPAQ